MTIHEYLLLLRRRWWLLALTTGAGIVLAVLWTAATPRTYTTGATIVVSAASAEGVASSADLQRVGTLAALAGTDAILEPAASATGLSVAELRGSVGATARGGTTLIDVSSAAGTPDDAARRANAVADALTSAAATVSGSGDAVTLETVTRAQAPSDPTSPRPRSNIAVGAIIGLALGVGAVLLLQALDTRIRSIADLPRGQRFAGVTSLPAQRGRLSLHGKRTDPRSESFRQLRANLQFGSAVQGTIAVAGVTSSSETAEVAQHLGRALGEIGMAVVVVDADFRVRGPRQARGNAASGQRGLSDVLAGSASLPDVELKGGHAGVRTVPTGLSTDGAAPLLSTTALGDVLTDLQKRYDFVLLVCPPVLERSETSVIAALSGASLLVIDAGNTRRSDLQQSLELLESVGVDSVSLVIDGATWRAGAGGGTGARVASPAAP